MTIYSHAGDPVGDYVDHDTRLAQAADRNAALNILEGSPTDQLRRAAVKAAEAALIAHIAAQVAAPFRPTVRLMRHDHHRPELELVIGEGPGFVRVPIDPEALSRYGPRTMADVIVNAGRRAFEAAGIPVEANIERGTE